MARELNLTTQKQEFIRESYLKEIMTRINWRRRYAQNLPTNSHTKLKVKMKDYFKLPNIPGSNFQTTRDSNIHQNVQTLKDRSKMDEVETASAMDTQMRPVSPKMRSLLYYGTSKEEEGRYRYMKARNHLKPEDKYCYPVTTSWDYGWQMGNVSNNNCHLYRRCRIVNDTFYRNNGLPSEPNPKDMAF